MDKQAVFEQVVKMTAPCRLGRCLYASLSALFILKKEYPDVIVQAGSMSWPIIPPELDDGVSPTHFSYEWSSSHPDTLMAILQNRMPEMHVWLVIPSTEEIIDMTTYELPTMAEEKAKLKWQSARPPDYLWVNFNAIPSNVIYRANRDAIVLAMNYMERTIKSGQFREFQERM